jgi:hypothetical protein
MIQTVLRETPTHSSVAKLLKKETLEKGTLPQRLSLWRSDTLTRRGSFEDYSFKERARNKLRIRARRLRLA